MHGPGVTLGGRYRLDAKIGGGGMGEVWRGTDEVLGRTVAVKLMLPALVREAGFAQRFLSEARAMASVSHPGVVDIHDYGNEESGAFLVMEFVEGESLADALGRDGRLSPARTLEVIAQAAEALHAVHQKGIVHRDIKPGNLMLRTDGSVLLTDFGIARSQAAAQLTATGAMIGTAPYISPEQALGRPATPVSDVYALGVVAYQCLSGQRPFDGDSPIEVAMKHIREAPPDLPLTLPSPVRDLVLRALAKEPAHRWASASQLADAARRAGPGNGTLGGVGVAAPTAPVRPPSIAGSSAVGSSRPITGTARPVPPSAPPAGPTRPATAPAAAAPPAGRPTSAPPRRPATRSASRPGTGTGRPTPGRSEPPLSVTLASLLMLISAAAGGVYFLAALAVFDAVSSVYEQTYDALDLDQLAPVFTVVHVAGASLFLLAGFLLLILSWLVYRGSRGARNWTIMIAVGAFSCLGLGALVEQLDIEQLNQERAYVSDRLAAELPDWYGMLTGGSLTLGLGALLVAVVLLLFPASYRHFRTGGRQA